MSGCQQRGRGGGNGVIATGYEVSFWDNNNAPESGSGVVCIIL